jgi:hypothetical protein
MTDEYTQFCSVNMMNTPLSQMKTNEFQIESWSHKIKGKKEKKEKKEKGTERER